MGKANNLGDFMTDLADAIREKTGVTEPINPQDFADTIKGIQAGGIVEANDVTFRDYDGVVLHAFTQEQFLSMSEMPPLPTREGLICQGWNWELEGAKAQVTECGKCDIGATYITDDGKTRLYIRIAAKGRMNIPLVFSQATKNPVTIDWGDGSEPETPSGNTVKLSHQYTAIGNYCITIDVPEDGFLKLGNSSNSGNILGPSSTGSTGRAVSNMLEKVEIGNRVTILSYSFLNCSSLASITIPSDVTLIEGYAFKGCSSLAHIVIPNGVQSIPTYTFCECYSLSCASIPNSVTSIANYALKNCSALKSVVLPSGVAKLGIESFNSCYSLKSIIIPNSVTEIGASSFEQCYSLASVVIPSEITEIESEFVYKCYSLTSVVIPSGVTAVNNYVFYGCGSLRFCDFSSLSAVPTLLNSNSFSSVASDCNIIVPDSLYDEWIAATNWSSHASKIIKKTDWDAQNA